MERHEPDTWQEDCRVLIGGVLDFPARASVWSYDGRWGGEATLPTAGEITDAESASLGLIYGGYHPVTLVSVSHRTPGTTTILFEGKGDPPFSPHAVRKTG